MLHIRNIGSSQKKALQLFGVFLALLTVEVVMMMVYNAYWVVR